MRSKILADIDKLEREQKMNRETLLHVERRFFCFSCFYSLNTLFNHVTWFYRWYQFTVHVSASYHCRLDRDRNYVHNSDDDEEDEVDYDAIQAERERLSFPVVRKLVSSFNVLMIFRLVAEIKVVLFVFTMPLFSCLTSIICVILSHCWRCEKPFLMLLTILF